jgi:saccharopine dehydrogenase-like NADP-dependent oxidoreductase
LAASNTVEEARRLTAGHTNALAVRVDMSDRQGVKKLVEEADLVVRSVAIIFST